LNFTGVAIRSGLWETVGMAKKQVFLKPVIYPDGRWIGAYECSVCEKRFQPDETDLGKLSREFAVHERAEHRKREDVRRVGHLSGASITRVVLKC
jgi:hypothetical protein